MKFTKVAVEVNGTYNFSIEISHEQEKISGADPSTLDLKVNS